MEKYSVDKLRSRILNCTYALYSYQAKCYVLFGNKRDMLKAYERLNKIN